MNLRPIAWPPARKWPISVNGGYEPRWRSNGRELYYLAEDQTLMAVPVSWRSAIWCTPAALPDAGACRRELTRNHYVPNRDGSRFLIHRRSKDVAATTITVVLNGMMALKR